MELITANKIIKKRNIEETKVEETKEMHKKMGYQPKKK